MRSVAVALGALIAAAVGFGLARRFSRYEVAGASMLPALRPGDWVIVDRDAYRSRLPRAGEIALARDPREAGRTLVKRVAHHEDDRGVWLLGDNAAESTDSRDLGGFSPEELLGRVRWRYWPPPLGSVPETA